MTKEIILWSCLMVGLFVLVKSGVSVNNTLRCYQCEIPGKDESACHESDLRLCPSNQAYDRCLTNFRMNDSGYFIIKKCALAPCEFKTLAENTIFSTSCELDWSTMQGQWFDCAKCCRGDGCNRKNSGYSQNAKFSLSNGLMMPVFFSFFLVAITNSFFSIFSDKSCSTIYSTQS